MVQLFSRQNLLNDLVITLNKTSYESYQVYCLASVYYVYYDIRRSNDFRARYNNYAHRYYYSGAKCATIS